MKKLKITLGFLGFIGCLFSNVYAAKYRDDSTKQTITEPTFASFVNQDSPYKDIAEGPNAIIDGRLRLLPPKYTGVHSATGYLNVFFPKDSSSQTITVPVDADGEVTLIVQKTAPNLQLSQLLSANGENLLHQATISDTQTAILYKIHHATSGIWQATLTRKNIATSHRTFVGLSVENTPTAIYSHFNHRNFWVDEPISLSTWLFDAKSTPFPSQNSLQTHSALLNTLDETVLPTPLISSVDSATMLIIPPKGKVSLVNLLEPFDQNGIYQADFTPQYSGVYKIMIQVSGISPSNGQRYYKSTEHVIPVVVKDVELDGISLGTVNLTEQGNYRIPFQFDLTHLNTNQSVNPKQLYHVVAEIWADNEPLVWFGGLAHPTDINVQQFQLIKTVDVRMLQNRKDTVSPEFSIQNVMILSADSRVPLSTLHYQPITMLNRLLQQTPIKPGEYPITPEMLEGPIDNMNESTLLEASNGNPLLDQPKLNKVGWFHGYCSAQVWPTRHQGIDSVSPAKPYANMSIKDYADFIEKSMAHYHTWSAITHSQGGLSVMYILTHYKKSGLTKMKAAMKKGQRLIQALAAPFSGTRIAGIWADLGLMGGKGCGSNSDLTKEGAARFLATTPDWVRNEVYFYTTSSDEETRCDERSGWLLGSPEDGVVSKENATLERGHDQGHTYRECHTDGMHYQAQTQNKERNLFMNKHAARM